MPSDMAFRHMVLGTVCNGDRDFWQLRCNPLRGNNLKKERCELKGTRHNGRSGKDGVYNPLHNDRRFNPEHSEHIDNERVRSEYLLGLLSGIYHNGRPGKRG